MELPDNPELRLALYRARREEALHKASDAKDPSMRASWLRIAENYFYLTQPQPGP
jgi:hypothetical protein